ncbi:MAG: hypothetical protein EOP06_00530 [Proteobacteria bacterium]|nr:MAG: hypothetical protein EOP06_00530 [Pseudomonadota bacterium]
MLELWIDNAEPRVKRDLLWLTLTGTDWRPSIIEGDETDSTTSTNCYVDPVSHIAMLQPLQLAEGWHYEHDGIKAKYGLGQFSVSDPNQWREIDNVSEGDTYIESIDDIGAQSVTCNAFSGKNQPAYFSTFVYNSGNDVFIQAELEWENGTFLRLWSNGQIEVWRGQRFIKSYSVNAKHKGDKTADQQNNSTLDLCIFPFNTRDLLVSTNAGGGFVHTFSEIEDGSDDPITEGKVTLHFPSEGKTRFQFASVVFATSGTLLSRKAVFRTPPASSQSQSDYLYFDANGTGFNANNANLVSASNPSSAFVANDENVEFRVKVTLSGNGTKSPYIYAWSGGYGQEHADTDDSEAVDLMPYVEALSFACDANGKGAQLNFAMREPSTLPFAQPTIGSNRPILLRWNDKDIFRGRTAPPEVTWGKSFGDDSRDLVSFTASDYWKVLEGYLFSDPIGLDGWRLDDALKFLFEMCGFGPAWLVLPDFDDFEIPRSGRLAQNRWGSQIQVGDTPAQWISRLLDTYAGNYSYGWKPHSDGYYKYIVEEPNQDQAESITVFDNLEAAKAVDEIKSIYRVFAGYHQQELEPEATVIFVTGRDSHTDQPIFVVYEDVDASNPTLAPSSQPENWLGEQRKFGYIDPGVCSIEAAEYVADILFERLTKKRYIGEFQSRFLIDDDDKAIWRGDVIKAEGLGRFRITSISVDILKDYDPDVPENAGFRNWSTASYTGEYLGA